MITAQVMAYHRPILLQQVIDGLEVKPNGTYVDATFGGGGHAVAILKKLGAGGRLFAFDQDPDASDEAAYIDHPGFTFIASNFKYMRASLRMYNVDRVDGILADVGVSSHQLDVPGRGFSTRFEARLDMRMDPSADLSAYEIVNTYSQEALKQLFYRYGELRNAPSISKKIVASRQSQPLETTTDLMQVLSREAPPRRENKFFAQVFQALRIEVNDELNALESLLEQSTQLLRPGGRLAVISFHSLEDRLVKHFMRSGNFEDLQKRDVYGNVLRALEPLHRKPMVASESEMKENPRSRSARLRIAKRTEYEQK